MSEQDTRNQVEDEASQDLELEDEDAEKVGGGDTPQSKVQTHDISITKHTDSASPNLF